MKAPIIETNEQVKLAAELVGVNKELIRSKGHSTEYIIWLEEMIFMISHKVRQPVAHILGISGLFRSNEKSPKDAKKLMGFMRDSALSLDKLTRELSKFISKKITKMKGFK